MSKKIIFSIAVTMFLGFCLVGCTTPAQFAKDTNSALASGSASGDSSSDALVDSGYVLHDVMYFKDEVKDATLVVDNGYATIACSQDKFMAQFIVNGVNLFDGTYNIPYKYEKKNGVGRLDVDFTSEVQYRFTQCTDEEFGDFYDEFEPRMLKVLKEIEASKDAASADSKSDKSDSTKKKADTVNIGNSSNSSSDK